MYLIRGEIKERLDRDVKVKLSNGQEIKAVRINKLDLNEDEQYPVIKKGTETLVLADRDGNAFALGSIAQTTKQESKKQYLVHNEIVRLQGGEVAIESEDGEGKCDKVTLQSKETKIESDKMESKGDESKSEYKSTEISNGTDELFNLLVDLVDEISSLKVLVVSGSSAGMWGVDPSVKAKLELIKAKFNAFN